MIIQPTTQNDLFPETLLVSRSGEYIFTTSRKIAEHFGKQHKDVLKAIRKVVSDSPEEISRRNFAPRDYIDERGKKHPYFELTHDGFAFTVMGFTGEKAFAWKWKFIESFRTMEEELLATKEHARPNRWRYRSVIAQSVSVRL